MTDSSIVILEHVHWVEILALVGYAVMCLLSLLLVVYLRVNRREAFKGDPHASRKLILPAFEPLLWLLTAVTGIYVVFFSIALQINLYTIGFPNLDREFFYCGRMFVFVVVLMFIRQKSVSLPALRCAVLKSLLVSSYTLPIIALFTRVAPKHSELLFFVKLAVRPMLLLFVVYACVLRPPAGRANAHVLRTHGWFIFTYHVFLAAYSVTQQYMPHSFLYPLFSYTILVWSSMCPLMIWRILRADTEYWRGMGKRVCSLQHEVHRTQPSSHLQAVAAVNEDISTHGIHVLIESHRDFLIDFAHLELKRKLSSARHFAVFSGLLRSSKAVSAKVYTPQQFTEEIVGEFSHEAALCASLSHPNIVEFFGMCVCPPTVCLVSELCQYTLGDVLATRRRHRQTTWLGHQHEEELDDATLDNQRLQLNVAYMLDCSRAVAYVHSFSPPFLHRDIKPANFLLGKDNTLKLTDFSDSRRLPSEIPVSVASETSASTLAVLVQPKMTVTGTVDYMAPEMIGSRTGLASYGEAADVFSLAITFWEMLHPRCEKYPGTNSNHLLVFEGVLSGSRPPIDEHEMAGAVPRRLLELITSAWRNDPSLRPTAQQLVKELEEIQEELLAVLAQELLTDRASMSCGDLETVEKVFTGEYAVDRMKALKVIESKGEGVRLGRALMDAGFLHHFEHASSFRHSESSLYFFDNANISFCQPLAILEEAANASQNSDDGPVAPQSFAQLSCKPKLRKRSRLLSHLVSSFSGNVQTVSDMCGSQSGDCACRLLGQLRDAPTTPSSGRFRRQRRRQTPNRSSCSVYSNDSSSNLASAPRRWQLRRNPKSENSLQNKLLGDDQQEFIIDFPRDGAEL
jgi:serine/threonine protein kinase